MSSFMYDSIFENGVYALCGGRFRVGVLWGGGFHLASVATKRVTNNVCIEKCMRILCANFFVCLLASKTKKTKEVVSTIFCCASLSVLHLE